MPENPLPQDPLHDILEELKSQRQRKKDIWDRLGAISTLILGIVGLWFTYSYNMAQSASSERQSRLDQEAKKYQTRVLEMQAVKEFIPYLTAEDENQKEVALLVITTLGSTEFATQFAKINPSKGTQTAVDRIMASAQSADQAQLPQSVSAQNATSSVPDNGSRKTGWVYLGHYDIKKGRWGTKYFDISDTANPSTLLSSVLKVSGITGAINVRIGMPTPTGGFLEVRNVLKPSSQVVVRTIREWYSTGYMWAEVDYES